MTITYTQEDCMVGMARYPDRYFDLAIVDIAMRLLSTCWTLKMEGVFE